MTIVLAPVPAFPTMVLFRTTTLLMSDGGVTNRRSRMATGRFPTKVQSSTSANPLLTTSPPNPPLCEIVLREITAYPVKLPPTAIPVATLPAMVESVMADHPLRIKPSFRLSTIRLRVIVRMLALAVSGYW